jgi:hypothetical protein
MDTAYRVTVITEIYGRPAPIDRLVAEVQQIEAEIVEHVAHRLLARDGDAQAELLDGDWPRCACACASWPALCRLQIAD